MDKNKNEKTVGTVGVVAYRQGDVGLVPVASIPRNTVPVEGPCILAYGEVTGHCHQIFDDVGCALVEGEAGVRYLSVERIAELKHQEHSTISLPAGVYEVRHQREYTPTEIVRVRD